MIEDKNKSDIFGNKIGYWEEPFGYTCEITNAYKGYIDKGYYIKGWREGRWKSFYENGTIETVTDYKKGQFNGLYQYFNRNSKLIKEIIFFQ